MELDRHGVEVLGRQECLELLDNVPVGRIGLSVEALPVVLPVNFVRDGDRLVVATPEGHKTHAARWQTVVAFEADDWEPVSHRGWSVLVQGRARVLRNPAELASAKRLPLRPWGVHGPLLHIAIEMERVSGRRVHGAPRPSEVADGHPS